ncbi:unnamed protein product [Tilletia laevis]|uniref:Uncharacterized protein n=1 Tax=Tilletia laevis TaxID=157183 RepID=A0A9N8M347_9BASI|nr:unnamed protein product [Tilletia caries]CAD6942816.1 unnamed protein product [Tilletia laevis]CAD6944062.1 unnamed protein product [Tilletia controversa]CAD6953120.1 unnamed protein product [Tilletia laevis]
MNRPNPTLFAQPPSAGITTAQENALFGALELQVGGGAQQLDIDQLLSVNSLPPRTQDAWRTSLHTFQDLVQGTEPVDGFDDWLKNLDIPSSSQPRFAALRTDILTALTLSQVAKAAQTTEPSEVRAPSPSSSLRSMSSTSSLPPGAAGGSGSLTVGNAGDTTRWRGAILYSDQNSKTAEDGNTGKGGMTWDLKEELRGGQAQNYRGPLSPKSVLKMLETAPSAHARHALTGACLGYLQYYHFLGWESLDTRDVRRGPKPGPKRAESISTATRVVQVVFQTT